MYVFKEEKHAVSNFMPEYHESGQPSETSGLRKFSLISVHMNIPPSPSPMPQNLIAYDYGLGLLWWLRG